MLNYNLTLADISALTPLQVEFLLAGLIWSGRITVLEPKKPEEESGPSPAFLKVLNSIGKSDKNG